MLVRSYFRLLEKFIHSSLIIDFLNGRFLEDIKLDTVFIFPNR